MGKLSIRLAALELQRPADKRTVADMTDGELIQLITGHPDTVITNVQLERIAQGETWEQLKNG